MSKIKQVIVARKDLQMSPGKLAAQAGHASIGWIVDRIQDKKNGLLYEEDFSDIEKEWMEHSSAKVCLRVDSEHELMELAHKAKRAGLITTIITDAGLTKFNGIPTKTCVGIGPDLSEKIDSITGQLKLF
jgi:PTH2 family peptidyl-tRNA hydrolase